MKYNLKLKVKKWGDKMFYLSNINSLSYESIRNQSSIDCLDNFYSGHDKHWADIGIIYITPFQVLQTFIRGLGLSHDTIIKTIESDILKNRGVSRIFMRLLRRYTSEQEFKDIFYWDVDLQFGDSMLEVREITRQMYEVASKLQEYLINMLRAEGIEVNKDNCIFLDDIIEEHNIKISNDIKTKFQEPFYGTSLNSYIKNLLQKTQSNSESIQTDELLDR